MDFKGSLGLAKAGREMNDPISPDFGGEPNTDQGRGHSGNGNIRRIDELERKMAAITVSVARIEEQLKNVATKEDVANLENKFLWRVGGLMITAMAAIAAILRYLAP